jgi:4'-phosphopantetheinyl transferase
MRITVHPCPAFPPAELPAADEVRVWVVRLDPPPVEPDELLGCLTPDERDRAGRYRAGPVRHQFVVGRALLRRVLGGCLGARPHAVPITYTAAGKPILSGGELHFNLTHTTGLALIAVGRRRVGIDVEGVRDIPGMDGLVDRFFSAAERSAYRVLPAAGRTAAFFRGWTCKEAVIKAAGATVQCLDGFDVELDPARPPAVLAVRDASLSGAGWAIADWEPVPGYAAAVAVEGAGPVWVSSG